MAPRIRERQLLRIAMPISSTRFQNTKLFLRPKMRQTVVALLKMLSLLPTFR